MRRFFSAWNPETDHIIEDSRKISIALIIAGLVGFFVQEVNIADAVSALLIGLTLWAFAVQKR